MNAREMLVTPVAYMPPAHVIEGLAADDAERHVPGTNHSIAETVAHVAFWQDWFCRRCEGASAPMPATAAAGWPEVVSGSWPDIQRQFVTGLERAVALGAREGGVDAPIAPAIESPLLAHYTIRNALVHIANHNAHHLGQIIVLRQLMGLWPPPSGSWTW